jgi:SAM-dependent methyltransferase
MQGYNEGFAHLYELRWGEFSRRLAHRILALHDSEGLEQRSLLDVCCGTGHLIRFFLERGFTVTGIDISDDVLAIARFQSAAAVGDGKARFETKDACHFEVDGHFSLAVSTYDALNHLPDLDGLVGCFSSVANVLLPGGLFVFDLNTRAGLQRWNQITVNEDEEAVIISRGIFTPEMERAHFRITGFLSDKIGGWSRFEQHVYNTPFVLSEVTDALHAAGFSDVRVTDGTLGLAVPHPEELKRAFFVAKR